MLGLVAGGVAHDFNDMLTVMQGQLELMRSETPTASESPTVMEQAARLTTQLLRFGKRQERRAQTLDVGEVVASTLALLERAMPPQIQLEVSGRRPCSPIQR